MPGAPAVLVVALDGARVEVRSEVDGVLPWLREMLEPGFTVVPGAGDGALPRVEVGAETSPAGPSLDTTFPCFALDGEVLHLAGRRDGVSWVLHDERWGTRYVVGPGGVRITPTRPGARLRMAAFRVVRELASALALRTPGPVLLHAACVAWEGHGVVLAGPKRAGKTTLLARSVAATRAGIVANDRVLLRPVADGWQATGVPTIVSVRAGTQRRMPELFRSVAGVERPVDLTLEEAAAAGPRSAAEAPSRLSLSPAQFAHELGAHLVAGVPLASVSLVSVEPDAEPFAVRAMSRDEAADALGAVRFGARRATEAPTVFAQAFGAEHLEDPARADLASAPWFRVVVGEGLLRSPTAPEALLRALSAAG